MEMIIRLGSQRVVLQATELHHSHTHASATGASRDTCRAGHPHEASWHPSTAVHSWQTGQPQGAHATSLRVPLPPSLATPARFHCLWSCRFCVRPAHPLSLLVLRWRWLPSTRRVIISLRTCSCSHSWQACMIQCAHATSPWHSPVQLVLSLLWVAVGAGHAGFACAPRPLPPRAALAMAAVNKACQLAHVQLFTLGKPA